MPANNPELSRMLQEQAEKEQMKKSAEKIEVLVEGLPSEQAEQAKLWLGRVEIEERAKASEPANIERAPSELQNILDIWLAPEKLDALHAITTQEEAMTSPLRTEARLALAVILREVKMLGVNSELQKKYKILSRAIGMINSGSVDHNR